MRKKYSSPLFDELALEDVLYGSGENQENAANDAFDEFIDESGNAGEFDQEEDFAF